MNTTHTPAPWNTITDPVMGILVRKDGLILAKMREAPLSKEESQANASLIAMAPELLELVNLFYQEVRFKWFEAEFRGPNEDLLNKAMSVMVRSDPETVGIQANTLLKDPLNTLIQVIEILWRHTNKLTMNDDDLAFVHNTIQLLQLDKLK